MTLNQILRQRLSQRREAGLYRQRRTLSSAQGAHVSVAGKILLNFCSNDYLGLANHPDIAQAMNLASDSYGVGSGASHLVCGHSLWHQQLEQDLARLTGRPRALLFSTGYMANMGVISALLGKGDCILQDRLNHASLLDGGLLSGARFQRFTHNNVDDLARRLERLGQSNKLIAVDGVFSMDGDLAPLPDIVRLAEQHDAWLMVDDAHGLGCLGDSGGGVSQIFGLDDAKLPILMGTLGKAFGCAGAFVAGSEELIEALIQFSRTYIYTTALPPALAAAACKSVQIAQAESWRRDHLNALIGYYRKALEHFGLPSSASKTAIQPMILGDSQRALKWSHQLYELGVWVGAIRPPTVPAGTSRLRITLSASHSFADVDSLIHGLLECQKKVK